MLMRFHISSIDFPYVAKRRIQRLSFRPYHGGGSPWGLLYWAQRKCHPRMVPHRHQGRQDPPPTRYTRRQGLLLHLPNCNGLVSSFVWWSRFWGSSSLDQSTWYPLVCYFAGFFYCHHSACEGRRAGSDRCQGQWSSYCFVSVEEVILLCMITSLNYVLCFHSYKNLISLNSAYTFFYFSWNQPFNRTWRRGAAMKSLILKCRCKQINSNTSSAWQGSSIVAKMKSRNS